MIVWMKTAIIKEFVEFYVRYNTLKPFDFKILLKNIQTSNLRYSYINIYLIVKIYES